MTLTLAHQANLGVNEWNENKTSFEGVTHVPELMSIHELDRV